MTTVRTPDGDKNGSPTGATPIWGVSQIAPADVMEHLAEIRESVDRALDEYTRFSCDSPARLTNAVRNSLLSSGKRLRPTLATLACELCGGNVGDAIPACVALESVHVYSLIHDDLPAMDDDDLRRGVPTCHKQFDVATAILAGDALLTFAFEALTAHISDPVTASQCVLMLSRAAGPQGMVGGQTDDVVWGEVMRNLPGAFDLAGELFRGGARSMEEGAAASTAGLFDFLTRIHRRKTGSLIIASLQLGGLVAHASKESLAALKEFGRHFGQAFQISDDLLDALGDEATVGKRVGKDEEAGKLTYVSLLGIEGTKRALDETVAKAKDALEPFAESCGVESTAYRTIHFLVDGVARRER
ncbi:MAG: polyprenyl synthetase family protein [Thermoguttaceae bacterium]|nr:polyprenyl synthetase family protein [Thermoguttaceae bacterium]